MAVCLFCLRLVLLCVSVLGLVPNVLSAIVLLGRRNSIPGAWILLGLALADGGLLFVQGGYTGVRFWCDLYGYDEGNFLFPIYLHVHRWFWIAGTYLVIALAAGRYIAVSLIWPRHGIAGYVREPLL